MRRIALRLLRCVAVASLVATAPTISAAALSSAGDGAAASGGALSDPVGTSCDDDGISTSFVLDASGQAAVEAVAVTGLAPACAGQVVHVVVQGVSGTSVVTGTSTTVPLAVPVPAAEVTTLTVAVTLP